MAQVTPETFTSLAETTTTADPGTGGTTLAVTSRSLFPQSGQFGIVVQNAETDKTNRELMLVTAGFGTGAGSFTVTRNLGGVTGAFAHPVGSYVSHVLTAEALKRWINDYVWLPRHHKMLAWTMDPTTCVTNTAPNIGVPYYARMNVPETMTFGTMQWFVAIAGTGCSNCFLGLYNSAGTRIGVTADQGTAFQSTGYKSAALTVDAGQSLTVVGGPDVAVWAAFLIGTATTSPSMLRTGRDQNVGYNLGLTVTDKFRTGSAGSGLTALPATQNLAALTDWYGYLLGAS